MATKQAKIAIKNVSRVYDLGKEKFYALKDVSLQMGESEFVTVVGPSGCGKSTMMNLLAGLDRPTVGTAEVDGKIVDGPSPDRGVIFQQYALFPWLTVRQNVEFGLKSNKQVSKQQRHQIAQHFIDLVGLSQFADSLPKTLSGGMKQRCAIARAYAVNPSILLMDEPFGALDALTRVQLQSQLLDAWSQDKRTVMFITHDVDEAVFLANRVVIMAARPGRIYDIVPIDLPYPRDDEMRLSSEFAQIRNRIWQAVYHQDPNHTYSGEIGPLSKENL